MPTFVFAYRAPRNYTPGDANVAAEWQNWFETLGSQLADAGNPVFTRGTVGNCGSDTGLGGYSLVTADSLEAAIAAAGGCPLLSSGGGVEVGELTLLNPASLAASAGDHQRATAVS